MRRLLWLSVLPSLLAACLPAPFLRRGPSVAHIEGARASDRFLVKGRAPYVIVPRISRTSSLRLGSGAIVRAEARDKVFAVTLRNDSGIEHWVSSSPSRPALAGRRLPGGQGRTHDPAAPRTSG
jgi:hypothetical protein